MPSISPTLLDELTQLNPRQRQAALAGGDVVVRAGPGSGKTRTLVARAAVLLETDVSRFRGAACITYTNAAATEVGRRLRRLGVASQGRLTCSTLHSFCLNQILRTHAPLTGEWLPAPGQVLDDPTAIDLLQRCFDDLGIADLAARYRQPTITKIRRLLACGEDTGTFDDREVDAANAFDRKLRGLNLIDFEAMVTRAVNVVRTHEPVRDLLRARYPHLIVDEYQDLGGVLHQLVLCLHDQAGIQIFAVGDADQSVFGFTGADPKYLEALAARADVLDIELDINYRSGPEIIRASEAALGRTGRGRRAIDGALPGNVAIVPVDGALDAHAVELSRLIDSRLTDGVAAEKIAVLYPARGVILDALLTELDRTHLAYLHERDDQLPSGSMSRFIQRCASRAVMSAQIHRCLGGQDDLAGEILQRSEAPSLFALDRDLRQLRAEASRPLVTSRLAVLRQLQRSLDPTEPSWPEDPALPWLERLDEQLELADVGANHPDRQNVEALAHLGRCCQSNRLVLQDLAAGVEVLGKVVVTTYHSAKGREFDTVILPGLLNGLVPRDVNVGGRWRPAAGAELSEQRRGFYVAVSRAETHLYLLTGPGYYTAGGYWISKGPSDFLVEMDAHLRASDQAG